MQYNYRIVVLIVTFAVTILYAQEPIDITRFAREVRIAGLCTSLLEEYSYKAKVCDEFKDNIVRAMSVGAALKEEVAAVVNNDSLSDHDKTLQVREIVQRGNNSLSEAYVRNISLVTYCIMLPVIKTGKKNVSSERYILSSCLSRCHLSLSRIHTLKNVLQI